MVRNELEGSENPTVNSGNANLPPVGELSRGFIEVGTRVWAMKTNLLNKWVKGVIMNIKEENNDEKLYEIRLDRLQNIRPKTLPAKFLAYEIYASVILPVGTRIIARYANPACRSAHYYAGIVAEPPEIRNGNRYLVFFDNGSAQYVKHEDANLVCVQSTDVADDVHENISDFVRSYLLKYPEYPLINVEVDQFVKTEYNFEWNNAKVLEVDGSMVKMLFPRSNRVEWIYGGSTRFKPLRKQLKNAEAHHFEAER